MNTDVPRILISHAASFWLGLVRVLCDNKAPRIKRQVASIDKKSDLQAKSGHFRTSTSNSASSSQKKQTTPKTVTSGASNIPSPRMHSFEDANKKAKKKATGVRPGRDVDVSKGSSTAKMKHLRQLERNRRHQNRVTRSIQDQIRKLRIE